MGKNKSLQTKITGTLYNKPEISKKALTFKKSLDEVKGMLDKISKPKK